MATTVSTRSGLVSTVDNASAGDEIVVSDGTYTFNGEWLINTADITIRAAEGARPHIKFSAGLENPTEDSGVKVDSSGVTVKGLEITRSGYKGIYTSQADDCLFEDLDVHHCNRWGIMNNGSKNVTFRNCDAHDNYDPQNNGQDSDGLNMAGTVDNMATGGLIEGCRAWNNGDDGFDMWTSENITIRNCWSWANGRGTVGNGNGFKLGSGSNTQIGGGHLVENCVSWNNGPTADGGGDAGGFWWNGEQDNIITVRNCTAGLNDVDYQFEDVAHKLENNISVGNNVTTTAVIDESNNTWNLGIKDPKLKAWHIPDADFPKLAPGSPCIGAGTNGVDLGAFPYEEETQEDNSTVVINGEDGTTVGINLGGGTGGYGE